MEVLEQYFLFPSALAVLALVSIYGFFGTTAFVTAALLIILEITLSFDNAVVNARVLSKMNLLWQRRFLTWGILIAVFGTRFLLPILIVSTATWLSPIFVTNLALFYPFAYGALLDRASYSIHAFGAVFLLLVALKYFLDTKKTVHWIHAIERRLSFWGKMDAIEIIFALAAVVGMSFLVVSDMQSTVLIAGVVGVILFVFMQGVMGVFSLEAAEAASRSIVLFVYLEILDSAFSLDGVVGAFALTSAIPIIAVGLGVGAYFVRSLTVFMVRKGTLDSLIFLEHGAHWAIFGLSVSLFANLIVAVPQIVTGTIGVAFVCAAYYSSMRARNRGTLP